MFFFRRIFVSKSISFGFGLFALSISIFFVFFVKNVSKLLERIGFTDNDELYILKLPMHALKNPNLSYSNS